MIGIVNQPWVAYLGDQLKPAGNVEMITLQWVFVEYLSICVKHSDNNNINKLCSLVGQSNEIRNLSIHFSADEIIDVQRGGTKSLLAYSNITAKLSVKTVNAINPCAMLWSVRQIDL